MVHNVNTGSVISSLKGLMKPERKSQREEYFYIIISNFHRTLGHEIGSRLNKIESFSLLKAICFLSAVEDDLLKKISNRNCVTVRRVSLEELDINLHQWFLLFIKRFGALSTP